MIEFQIENGVLLKYKGDGGDVVIPYGITEIGESAFDFRLKVKSVTIPDGVTRIRDYAFARCSQIKSIVIPDSVTDIGERAFFNCYGLQSIIIGNGTAFIGTEAFYNCDKIENLTLGNGVKEIGKYAFPSELILKECILTPDSEDAAQAKAILAALKAQNLYLPFFNDCIKTNPIFRKELQKKITEKRFRESLIFS